MTRLIRSRAPARICDNGGWTDTWFAGHGKVCNLAVEPGVEVAMRVFEPGDPPRAAHVTVTPSDPLLEAALEELPVPDDVAVEIAVTSDMPAGAATGTSAAASVALSGALDRVRGGSFSAAEVAAAAHRIETERLGWQSGIQDQLAAAHGGPLFIEMDSYPDARVTRLELSGGFRAELERRLMLVYLGRPHSSSAVHEQVIRRLEQAGGGAGVLDDLRAAAVAMRDALTAEDMVALGRALVANTAAQAALHAALIGEDARAVIGAARAQGALGWKVNGAGGDGGSVTILCDEPVTGLERVAGRWQVVPVRLAAEGLRVWEE